MIAPPVCGPDAPPGTADVSLLPATMMDEGAGGVHQWERDASAACAMECTIDGAAASAPSVVVRFNAMTNKQILSEH
jgi:hypothetical protein